jgi:hypothetical protein
MGSSMGSDYMFKLDLFGLYKLNWKRIGGDAAKFH